MLDWSLLRFSTYGSGKVGTLGFPSAQYFSSTFKLHLNATPAAYRRAHVRG